KENGLSLVIGFQLITALVVGGMILLRGRRRVLRLIPLAIPVLMGLVLCVYYPQWNRQVLSFGKYHRLEDFGSAIRSTGWAEALLKGTEILDSSTGGELVFYGDGIGGFTTVIKNSGLFGDIEYIMVNSGKADASSRGDMKTQTLSAHFPMLFHRDPKKVMVLGLASGVTAGEVLHYPVEQLDVVEISEQVIKGSNYFIPWNSNVLSDPRTNLIIQDGRAHLNLTREKYDVIISEPSNPWMAGISTLFTREFFCLARERLNHDGIFLQWLHSYQMDWSTFALVGRTFARVFPNSLLVATSPYGKGPDYLLVGLKGEDRLDREYAEKNSPYVRRSGNVSLSDPRLLYRLVVSEDLDRLFGPGQVNTDSRPALEFSAPKLIYRADSSIIQEIRPKKWLSSETRNVVQQVFMDIDSQIDFAEYALSVHAPFPGMVDLARATPSQRDRFFRLTAGYSAGNRFNPSLVRDRDIKRRLRSIQIEGIEKRIDLIPDRAAAYSYLGELYYEAGMVDESLASYTRSLRIEPENVSVYLKMGIVLTSQGDFEKAISNFKEILRLDSGQSEAQKWIGHAMARQGRFDEAVREYHKALEAAPDDPEVYSELGSVFARQGRLDNAVTYLEKAIQLKPDFPNANAGLGRVLVRQGKLEDAIAHFEEELNNRPGQADVHQDLAKAFFMSHRIDEAVAHLEKALLISPDLPGIHGGLGRVLFVKGEFEGAIRYFKKALQVRPDWIEPMNNLAWILATNRDVHIREPGEAIRFAEKACELTGYARPVLLNTLAAAYAAGGRFPEAVDTAQKAIALARSAGQEKLAEEI
ncbi:MAG: tetratricopeptide repeat protein, partial [Deltaproteobacteria bacterium]|nr:tetratricopeptide repeat protein [Deltaproteobacteria bacterium]